MLLQAPLILLQGTHLDWMDITDWRILSAFVGLNTDDVNCLLSLVESSMKQTDDM